MMLRRNTVFVLLFLLLTGVPASPASAQDTATAEQVELTLEDLFASPMFYGESFQGGRWAEEGPVIWYIQEAGDEPVTHLVSYNLETGEEERLIDGTNLYADDVGRLIQIEDYAYSPDESKVLIYTDSERVWRYNTKGFYYIYDRESQELTPVSDRDRGFQMFAKFAPDGERVAFVRDRNLFLVDLDDMTETQLTDSGSEGAIINGTSDWVYEEEFGLRDGWRWSPSGRYISFFQLDETDVREFEMADLRGQYPETERFRYPKAGEQNSEIRIGVIDTESGPQAPTFFDTGTWNAGGDSLEYIPQMGWTPEVDGQHRVWIFRLNRDQNQLDLLYGNPETMSVQTVLEEDESSWIDVETGFSDLDVGKLNYLQDDRHFVWVSEIDGYRHLYLYENDGTLVRQLTDGAWDVTDFHGVDEDAGRIYFTSTEKSPLERHLYRQDVSLSAGASAQGEPVRVTEREGWHDVNMSSDLRYYIDTYSSATSPSVVTLHENDGEQITVLEGNEGLKERLARYDLPEPTFMTVEGAAGESLNAYMVRPNDFDPDREYPLLMYVYGGPGSQTVRNAWGGTRMLWHQYLAREHDVLVVSVDNRGTGGRGKAFKSGPYRQLGQLEAQDQIAAARQLAQRSYIDPERVGIWGWSYGGYLTLMSMLTGQGPYTFDVGLAVAPVTNWRLYDTIYTERYMSTPQRNERGYRRGAPVNYADNLREEQDLLMVHGDLDDNVHYQNIVQMADALQEANKQFDMMVYPGRNHGIYGGGTRLHLFTMLTDYLTENL